MPAPVEAARRSRLARALTDSPVGNPCSYGNPEDSDAHPMPAARVDGSLESPRHHEVDEPPLPLQPAPDQSATSKSITAVAPVGYLANPDRPAARPAAALAKTPIPGWWPSISTLPAVAVLASRTPSMASGPAW